MAKRKPKRTSTAASKDPVRDPLAKFVTHGCLDIPPENLGSIVCEPVQLQCWWRGDVPARESVSCHLSGSPMWPGVLAWTHKGGGNVWHPGYEGDRLPDPVLLGVWVDGPPDALWDLWVTVQLGGAQGKPYVSCPWACLPAEFHERTQPTWVQGQVLTITLRQLRQDAQPTRFGIGLEFLAFRPLT